MKLHRVSRRATTILRFGKDISFLIKYLTVIPLALMGSESIAHSAFGLMGY